MIEGSRHPDVVKYYYVLFGKEPESTDLICCIISFGRSTRIGGRGDESEFGQSRIYNREDSA